MMYKELKDKYSNDQEFGFVNIKRDYEILDCCQRLWNQTTNRYDAPEHDVVFEERHCKDNGWEIYLEHSCDEWVIGGVEIAKKMKEYLEQAIAYCEKNP